VVSSNADGGGGYDRETPLVCFHLWNRIEPTAESPVAGVFPEPMLLAVRHARDAEQVRRLLPGAPRSLVLVTSRSPLIGLVAADGAHTLILDPPSAAEVRSLLARRLGAARIGAEPQAVDEIIQARARLPLALAIVAARAATTPGLTWPLSPATYTTPDPAWTGSTPENPAPLRTVFSWS
jgi:hypothetical protein